MTTVAKPLSPERAAFWRGYRLGLRRGRASVHAMKLCLEERLEQLDDCERTHGDDEAEPLDRD